MVLTIDVRLRWSAMLPAHTSLADSLGTPDTPPPPACLPPTPLPLPPVLQARKGAAFQPPALCRDDLASLAYTSGTGGMPKVGAGFRV